MSDENTPHKPSRPELDVEGETPGGTIRRWVIVRHATVWHPPTDIYEQEGQLVVVVEIAGMRDSDFTVTLQGQRLIISGIRQRMTSVDCAYHQLEIPFGEFRTEVSLPWPVSREAVTASYRDGFLRVALPPAQPRKVHIVSENANQAGPEHAEAGPSI